MAETMSVAEAKRRFSELIDRVRAGERFVVTRRGKPALALVPPGEELSDEEAAAGGRESGESQPAGLLAIAGLLADVDDLDAMDEEIYALRREDRYRPLPLLDDP